MKVLYITNIPSPYRVDFFNNVSKYCDLTVVFERDTATNRSSEWYSKKLEFNYVFLKSIRISTDSSISLEIIKFLRGNYDIIVLGGYSTLTSMIGIMYLKIKKIPFILNADGGFISTKENRLKKSIKTLLISSASNWLSTGEYTNKYLIYYGAKKKNIHFYPFTSINNVDILPKIFTREEIIALRIKNNIPYKKMILTVGRSDPLKGFDWMIKSLSKLEKEIGIYIVGDIPSEEIINIKNRLNMNNLHFLEFKPKEQLKELYLCSDLFVFPTRSDVWGLVINEAMAYALPVISSNCSIAALEIIEEGVNGFIVDVENEAMMYDKVRGFFDLSDEEIHKMKERCLKTSKKYTIEKMAKIHYEIFLDIMESNEINYG